MKWQRLSKENAALQASEWENAADFESILAYWENDLYKSLTSNDDQRLRGRIVNVFEESFGDSCDVNSYSRNLDFALKLYGVTVNEFGMTPAVASDDDVWRYIQIRLVPHLVYRRWNEASGKRINDVRFWKDTRRMWLKSLWWYIHLSLQNGDLEETRRVLANNNADDISQLLDRPGSGYRVDLCRAIMRRYGQSPDHGRHLLRNVLKLNVVRCVTLEPLLVETGIDEYVDQLFGYFDA